jgi:hypothetical protein
MRSPHLQVRSLMATRSANEDPVGDDHERAGGGFAATELLDALAERGHRPVVLTDQATIERGSRVRVSGIGLGSKTLSGFAGRS